jgi:predicted RNA binding protein YcfA (HicA-like mRNA interferase family)
MGSSGQSRGRALRRTLRRQGWALEIQRGGHYRGTHPDLGPGEFLALPGTPSDYRAEANALALARRMVRNSQRNR